MLILKIFKLKKNASPSYEPLKQFLVTRERERDSRRLLRLLVLKPKRTS